MALITTAAVPSARTVTTTRRAFAREHAPRGNRAGTIVLFALTAYVLGGTAWWIATRPASVLADSAWLGPGSWPVSWAWVLLLLAIAGGLATARAFGPITTTSAEATWLLSTPVDRAALLRPRLIGPAAAGTVAGVLVGRLTAFVAATTVWAPMTALGAVIGFTVVAVAVLAQGRVLPACTVPVLQWIFVAGGSGMALATTAGVVLPVVTTWMSVALAATVAIAAGAGALCSCGRLSRAEVDAGADVSVGAGTAVTALDVSALTGVLDARAWRRVGLVRSRHLPPGRARAMIFADALRYRGRPSAVAIAAVAAGCVWLGATIFIPVIVALTQLVAVFVVALVFSSGLRDLCADPALQVVLGAGDRALRLPLTVVPLAALTSVTALTAAAAALPPLAVVISWVGAASAAYRVRTRPARSYDGLILETGYGQVPVDLIRQLVHGPDVLLLTAAVLLIVV